MINKKIIVDTNFIIEATRVGVWEKIINNYKICTVDVCKTETQTGRNLSDKTKVNIATFANSPRF